MRFLFDNAISPFVSTQLNQLGYNSVHVQDYQLQAAPDEKIFERAESENRVIISADTDFAFLLAKRNSALPSVILFRKGSERNPQLQVELLKNNLNHELIKMLQEGSIVIIEEFRIRVRKLPLFSD